MSDKVMSEMAKRIFKDLYSFSNETIDDTFHRVAKEFAKNDEQEKITFELLKKNIWRPNSPVFFAAGTDHKVFSACWIVSIEDSMNSIYDVANVARKIFQNGAGIGIPIGSLREKDAFIYEGKKDVNGEIPAGRSSGPISFMKLYDAVGATTKSGGRARRAAIMMTMPVTHPDIEEFISCKEIDGTLSNMNISVTITDKFMQACKDNIPFTLISPSGKENKQVNARELWDKIVDGSWATADPGVLFLDTINRTNPLKKLMSIDCVNPCITGDTIINTSWGEITVKKLAELFYGCENETKIISYDTDDKEIEEDSVIWCGLTKEKAGIIELELEDGKTLKLTPDHKVYTENRGYVEAKDLKIDDVIIQLVKE